MRASSSIAPRAMATWHSCARRMEYPSSCCRKAARCRRPSRGSPCPTPAAGSAMGKVFVALALGVVLVILLAGLFVMSLGGTVSKEWSNRLMRYRVIAQAIAVLIVMAVLYFANQH